MVYSAFFREREENRCFERVHLQRCVKKERDQLERSEDQHSESISICILKHRAREYFSMDNSFLLYKRAREN